jgi:hypothetical protein
MTRPPASEPTSSTPIPPAHAALPALPNWSRPLLFGLGLLLLAAALYALLTRQDAMAEVLAAIRRVPWWMPLALVVSVLINWLLSSVVFWVLTARFARVGLDEMLRLTAAAWLLNYLPARPGLVGRLAYHKLVHRIPLRRGVLIVLSSIGATGLAAAITLAITLLAGPVAAAALLIASALAAALITPIILRRGTSTVPSTIALGLSAAVLWRILEMFNWAGRYALCFAMVGTIVGPGDAVLYAAGAQVASLVPVPMGLREWTVASLASVAAVGLAADLINRGVEVLVAIPIGLLSLRRLGRDLTLARHAAATPQDRPSSNNGSGGATPPIPAVQADPPPPGARIDP